MHVVELTRSSWREADTIDNLEFSILSHVQHALCVANDQGSSNNDFRYDIDLFGTGSSNCSDLGVRTDIDDHMTTTWKKIQRIALIGAQVDDDDVHENQDHPRISLAATTQSNRPDILEPVIANFTTQNQYLKSVEALSPSSNCRIICDHIHAKLPLNYLQRLVVEEILNHVIQNNGKIQVHADDQLLLYVRGEGGVGKSRVVQALELDFTLLSRRKELVISAPTGSVADGIRGSTIYTALGINTRAGKVFVVKANTLWSQRSLLIVDEVSMIDLKLLTSIDKQLQKARGLDISSTSIFGGLSLVVLMEDSYQFASVTGKTLWDNPIKEEDIHGKILWERFTFVLTLTEQMRQKTDLSFQDLLKKARQGRLNVDDVRTLNSCVATALPEYGSLDSIVVVQKNKTRHLVN